MEYSIPMPTTEAAHWIMPRHMTQEAVCHFYSQEISSYSYWYTGKVDWSLDMALSM